MRLGRIQTHSREQNLLENLAVVEAVISIRLPVQCDTIRSVIASLRAVNPYSGPVEGERGGGTVRRRYGERPVVSIPKPSCDAFKGPRGRGRRGQKHSAAEEGQPRPERYSRIPKRIRSRPVVPRITRLILYHRTIIVQGHIHRLNHRMRLRFKWRNKRKECRFSDMEGKERR